MMRRYSKRLLKVNPLDGFVPSSVNADWMQKGKPKLPRKLWLELGREYGYSGFHEKCEKRIVDVGLETVCRSIFMLGVLIGWCEKTRRIK